jgi:hypothetical protein
MNNKIIYRFKLKIVLIFFLVACFLSLFTSPIYAHILLTDGSIGAVVHINPEDDPIVGENADFFFEFKDKENRFSPQNCDCQYQISLGDKQIAQGDLFGSSTNASLDQASFSVIFPEKGLYTIVISGKPKSPNSFTEFSLKDSVRIERTSGASPNKAFDSNFLTDHNLHYLVFGVGVAIFLGLLFVKTSKKS